MITKEEVESWTTEKILGDLYGSVCMLEDIATTRNARQDVSQEMVIELRVLMDRYIKFQDIIKDMDGDTDWKVERFSDRLKGLL